MTAYAILVPDGAADDPLQELGGKTPLQYAETPHLDRLAREGSCGTALTIPAGLPAGSDVANLALMGYDPREYYCGRGPLEAASMGVRLAEDEYAFRCNLVSVEGGRLADYSSGHISTEEARQLIEAVDRELGGEGLRFHAGVSYRHLLVIRGDFAETLCTPPHDEVGARLEEVEPRGPGSGVLRELIRRSREVLANHPVNLARRKEGRRCADSIWPWGQGKTPTMPGLGERYGLRGAVITAVDLVKGLGVLAGLVPLKVPGATGYLDTDYAAKGSCAVRALDDYDLVYVHVEAPDEAGHEGLVEEKVRAIEMIDRHVAGPLLEAAGCREGLRLLVVPDHPTPLKVRTHTSGAVPFALWGTAIPPDGCSSLDEGAVLEGTWKDLPAWELLGLLAGA